MLHVHWLVPMLLYIIVAYVFLRWMKKRFVGLPSRTRRLFVQYLFCAIFATIFAALLGHLRFDGMTAAVMFVGFLNGFACLADWKATDVSLAKSSLFTFGDDLIAMGLYAFFVPTSLLLVTFWGGVGVACCIATAILFALHAYRKKESLAFFKYTLFFSILWGIAQFFEGYSATNKLPVGQFLFSWYIGAFIASCLILLFYKDPEASQQGEHRFTPKDVLGMFIYASGIASCLAIAYWVFSLAPQIIVQPVFLVGEAIVPMLVGMAFFGEAKTFDRHEWKLTALGICGILLIAFSR